MQPEEMMSWDWTLGKSTISSLKGWESIIHTKQIHVDKKKRAYLITINRESILKENSYKCLQYTLHMENTDIDCVWDMQKWV